MADWRSGVGRSSPAGLKATLIVVAVIALMVAVFIGLAGLGLVLYRTGEAGLTDVAWALGWITLGTVVYVLLWSLAYLVGRGASRRLNPYAGPWAADARAIPVAGEPGDVDAIPVASVPGDEEPSVVAVGGDLGGGLGERILAELAELNANMLLSPAQRLQKHHDRMEALARRLTGTIETAIRGGDFAAAERSLHDLVDSGADPEGAERLAEGLHVATQKAEQEDVRGVGRHCDELMAVGDCERVEEAVAALVGRYPESEPAKRLARRMAGEVAAYRQEQGRQLYAQVDAHVVARRWRQALAAAKTLLERHPEGAEAKVVREKMATLADNARLEEVRELRDEIREFITRRRFAEAVERAESVVQRFPDTAAATELSVQLARLRELAAEATAAEAGVGAEKEAPSESPSSDPAAAKDVLAGLGRLQASAEERGDDEPDVELARMTADADEGDRLAETVASAEVLAATEDLQQVSECCERLIAEGEYAQAELAAADFVAKHRRSADAAELNTRVRGETGAHLQQERVRLYEQMEEHIVARRWRKALVAAKRMLEAHAGTAEAEMVAARIDTIRDNARLEEVRQLRDTIEKLIGGDRFAEAVSKAEEVIRRFPNSAAAAALSTRMARLRRRAADRAEGSG